MTAQKQSQESQPKISRPKTIGVDRAITIIKEGGKATPAKYFSEQNGKVVLWVQEYKAGTKNILIQVQHGAVNTYGNLANDYSEEWIEVSDAMI